MNPTANATTVNSSLITVTPVAASFLNPMELLEKAIAENNPDVVLELVKNKQVDIYHRNSHGMQLIHIAASNGWCDVLKVLIADHADVRAICNELNTTPLFWAFSNNQPAAAALLIEAGADPTQRLPELFFDFIKKNQIQESGPHSLMFFALTMASGKDPRLLQVLLDKKITIENRDLCICILTENSALIRMILPFYQGNINDPISFNFWSVFDMLTYSKLEFFKEVINDFLPFKPYCKEISHTGFSRAMTLHDIDKAEMAEQIEALSEGFCQAWETQLAIIVRFGLKMGFQIGSQKVFAYTLKRHTTEKEFIFSFNVFLKEVNPSNLSSAAAEIILNALRTKHTVKTVNAYLEAFKKGELICFDTGWRHIEKGHNVQVILWKTLIFICNRGKGAGDRPGVTILEMEKQDRLEELINLILAQNEQTKNFFTSKLEAWPELEFIKVLPHKSQDKKGNCSWVSPETLLHALFYIALLIDGVEAKEAEKQSRELYKLWSGFDKTNAFERYITLPIHNNPESQNVADGIIRDRLVQECLIAAQPTLRKNLIGKIQDRSIVHFSPLHWALLEGSEEQAIKMVEAGVDVDPPCSHFTPLHLAAALGHLSLCQKLIEKGAKLKNGPFLESPIHLAQRKGHHSVVKWMIPLLKDVDIKDRDGLTLLEYYCSEEGYDPEKEEIVEQLILSGCDITIINRNGNSFLHLAAIKGMTKVIPLLLANGIDINHKSKEGFTALNTACLHDHSDVAIALLDSGANPEIENLDGLFPIHYACLGNQVSIVKKLLEKGTDLNRQSLNGNTSLLLSCKKKFKELTLLLLEAGAKPNIYNKCNESPLLYAEEIEVVNSLLEEGAEVNSQNEGTSPLFGACINERCDIAALLLSKGANPDWADKDGNTPLHVAVYTKNVDLVALLDQYKADRNRKNKAGKSFNDLMQNLMELQQL